MPGRVKISDSEGNELKVTKEGSLEVLIHSHPPEGERTSLIPFSLQFTNSAGSEDMRVNGSTTSMDFNVEANKDYDYYITRLSILIEDPGAKFNLFGALPALTNGVTFKWYSLKTGEEQIDGAFKENIDWFRLSSQTPTITDLSGAGADAIIVNIDLRELFGSQWGVHLVRGTKDKLYFTVRDDLSAGLTTFNIIAYGIKI